MALWWDPVYRQHLIAYDQDRSSFRKDAAIVWKKLTELGCPRDLLVEESTPLRRQVYGQDFY